MYTRHTLASIETLLFLLAFVLWMVLAAIVLFHIAHRALAQEWVPRPLVFCDFFTFIFLFWFIIPIAGYRTNEAYDLGRLKTYPLPAFKVFVSNILGAFTDLSVLLPLSGLLAVFLGTHPAPAQIPGGILLILALLFFMVVAGLTLVTTLYVLLPRLNLVAVGMFVLLGVLVWAVLLNLGLVEHPARTFNFFIFFRPEGVEAFRPYPPGQIGIALDCQMDGRWEELKVSLIQFAMWAAGILAFNYILVAYLWESDTAGTRGRSVRAEREISATLLDWIERLLAPVFAGETLAVFKKDMLEFAVRSPYFLMYKVLPGSIAPMIILLAMRWNLDHAMQTSYFPRFAPMLQNVTFVVVIMIVVNQGLLFAGNQFGFESETARILFTAPPPRRLILLGKNLFLGSLFLIDSLVLSFLILLYYPTLHSFFAWLSLLITLFLLILSIGNFVSATWPYWMPLDKPSFTLRTTMILGLVNMGAALALAISFAPAAALVILPHTAGHDMLSWLMMPVAVAYGVLFHQLTLGPAVGLLESNEFLILRRVADREQL